jgi:hypothetical protein
MAARIGAVFPFRRPPEAAMADRRIRDLRRLLQTVAEPYGATVLIEQTRRGHLRGTFAIGTRRAFIITGLSPSDRRISRHVEATARRTLRELCFSSSSVAAWRSAPEASSRAATATSLSK